MIEGMKVIGIGTYRHSSVPRRPPTSEQPHERTASD
jgi:hypothetical protein